MAIVAALVALFMALCTLPAQAAGSQSPLGFKVFCLKHPEECRGGGKGTLVLTDEAMTALKRVNAAVNSSIRPVNDSGGRDVWTLNASRGDCEDYVVTKRSRLIQMGLPASALRFAKAKTRSGEGHAVLIVRTDRGDLVLDNLTNAIRPKAQTGLRFISMSGTNPKHWVGA